MKKLITLLIPLILGACAAQSDHGTLLGIDSNKNLVRDDIDLYIDSLPDTSYQKDALRQSYIVLTHAMNVKPNDYTGIQFTLNTIAGTELCLKSWYGNNNKFQTIKNLTLNTPMRIYAYENFITLSKNMIPVLPHGQGCTQFFTN